MIVHNFKIKMFTIIFVYIIVFVPWSDAESASSTEMPTFLMPIENINNDNQSHDSSAQTSVKIEHRQLYDTVRHASGNDHNANNNEPTIAEDKNDKVNSSTMKTFISSRKSAVIQAIPRKVRGPGTTVSSTTTALPFARLPSLHTAAKDYGTGEPTTTIVYATSIPTTPPRTYVNIRPAPLLSNNKYRSTITDNKQDRELTKSLADTYSHDHGQQQEQKTQANVLEKPTFKIETNSEQGTSTPRSFETPAYQIEQRTRNLRKIIPFTRVRSNDDLDDQSEYNRNAFVDLHPEQKSFMQNVRSSQNFLNENQENPRQNYFQQTVNQNQFSTRYPMPQDDYVDDMYRDIPTQMPPYIPQKQRQYQQYQPLTVRDFDLLLQLLVLRDRRLHASQDPFSYTSDYNSGIPVQEDSNPFYDMSRTTLSDNNFYKNRDPNSLLQSIHSTNTRLLPSNVREELLFRMLLLALHLQPQAPKVMSLPRNLPPPILPSAYMYLGLPSVAAPSAPSSSPPSGMFLGYRQRAPNTKNPVRSVQVLGEID